MIEFYFFERANVDRAISFEALPHCAFRAHFMPFLQLCTFEENSLFETPIVCTHLIILHGYARRCTIQVNDFGALYCISNNALCAPECNGFHRTVLYSTM